MALSAPLWDAARGSAQRPNLVLYYYSNTVVRILKMGDRIIIMRAEKQNHFSRRRTEGKEIQTGIQPALQNTVFISW